MFWLWSALLFAAPPPEPLLAEPTVWELPDTGVTWDSTVTHDGGASLHFERSTDSTGRRTFASRRIPITVQGKTLELVGWVRAEDVESTGGIWLNTLAPGGKLGSETINEALDDSGKWQKQRIRVKLDERTDSVVIGGQLSGTGELWIDGLELRVDNKPIDKAHPRDPSAYWDDHRFDEGSGVEASTLTPVQLDNLVLLAEVWGFLKYHHPVVTQGDRQWDYSLFEVLPAVLDAPDAETGRTVITELAQSLGEPVPCRRCAALPDDRHLEPTLDWILDDDRLGKPLSDLLQLVYDRRPALSTQTYVQSSWGTGGAAFMMERSYAGLDLPDAGYRILAAFRVWNIFRYWSPYHDLTEQPWPAALARTLPALVQAETSDDYERALVRLLDHVHDSHTNLWGSLSAVPPEGDAMLPIQLRFVGDQPVVWQTVAGSPFAVGDVLVSLGGEPVEALVERMRPYYPASNPPTRLRNIARSLTVGEAGPVEVTLLRAGETHTVTASRLAPRQIKLPFGQHDRPGETIQVLGKRTAYVKFSSVSETDVASILSTATQHQGLVIDLRNYPSAFLIFELGKHLIVQPTATVLFTGCDIDNPGVFVWRGSREMAPIAPFLDVPVAVLVDEVTQSSAEYHAVSFGSSPRVRVFGSTTAGADGNVSAIPIPGGRRTQLSSIGVFYPDRSPTQRVGVTIDHEVHPTVAGIHSGRDEVLEEALRWIWGDEASEKDIIEAARRPAQP